ncbi:tetratricopeptide repeat protein [Aquimarina pacifica]|uniref:tetratricopeptide repeat protein n=1 Tax=Aquimarina pacifica TaxID=1296415 RepID=UPI00047049C1|nr:hypothetical protein [Aquimarina pacifica]
MENKDIELTQRYFDLELSEDELKSFENKLKDDKTFLEHVQTYKEGLDEVEVLYQAEKEERIGHWRSLIHKENAESERPENAKSSKVILLKWMVGIAASIMIFMVGKQFVGTSSSIDMASELQVAWDREVGLDYASMRGNKVDSMKSIIVTAYNAFDNSSYDEVIAILRNYPQQKTYYEDALFLKALSNYRKGEVQVALETLDTIINYQSGRKKDVAMWYTGLIYLEQEDLASAQKYVTITKNSPRIQPLKE